MEALALAAEASRAFRIEDGGDMGVPRAEMAERLRRRGELSQSAGIATLTVGLGFIRGRHIGRSPFIGTRGECQLDLLPISRVGSIFDRWRLPKMLRADKGLGPDFICFGAQKGGTTWLYDQLNHHADFWMPPIKEIHYFDGGVGESRSMRWQKLIDDPDPEHRRLPLEDADVGFINALTWLHGRDLDLIQYAKLFNPKGTRLSGDITPRYSLLPDDTIRQIMFSFPRVKVIYLARDPIERFWSHYGMFVRKHDKKRPETLAIVTRFLGRGRDAGVRQSMVTHNVARWRSATPEENFGLFFFDDLVTDPVALRARILTFLGADSAKLSGGLPPNHNSKGSSEKISMSPEVRAHLLEIFGDQIRACAAEFGGPAVEWPKKYGL